MSEEIKKEIIKAHIYGLTNAEIAECNGITVDEVSEALKDTALIEEKQAYMKESGWIE